MALAARAPDIILRPSIPLSATSDQPLSEVVRPPESASNDAADQAGGTPKEITPQALADAANARRGDPDAADAADADGEGADTEGGEGNQDEPAAKKTAPAKKTDGEDVDVSDLPKDLPGYAVREITKVRKAAREARAAIEAEAATAKKAAETAQADAVAARAELEALRAKPADTKIEEAAVDADPRPTRDAFDDPDLYDEAMVEWGKREGIRAADQKASEAQAAAEAEAKQKADDEARQAQEAQTAELYTKWQAERTAAIEKYPDYVEIVEADPRDGGPLISEPMAVTMQRLKNGTDVAYYLGKNTEEAARINALTTPLEHVIEITLIAARLSNPARRTPRQEPLDTIDSGASPADTSEQELDMEAYANQRNKKLNGERRPFFPQGGIH